MGGGGGLPAKYLLPFCCIGDMLKRVRALRGYFGPPMRSKNKFALHKFLLISLLEQ